MAKILTFPQRLGIQPLRLPTRKTHKVLIRVISRRHAQLTRWQAQFAIQRACGFRGLKGWTDECSRSGRWFTCHVGAHLIARFVRDMNISVRSGTLELWISNRPVRLAA